MNQFIELSSSRSMSTDNSYTSYSRFVDINLSSINGYELAEKIAELELTLLLLNTNALFP
jgi:hypothetical protein